MRDINELLKKIEELREDMEEVINRKGDLLDKEILQLSRLLDEHLVEYHRKLKRKTSNGGDL